MYKSFEKLEYLVIEGGFQFLGTKEGKRSVIKKYATEKNWIEKPQLPRNLKNLKYLDCSFIGLKELYIPETLTQLQRLYCQSNDLEELLIPETLTQLKEINYSDNRISNIQIPERLRNPQEIDAQNQQNQDSLMQRVYNYFRS